ncbi:hypothetical protein [Flavobacterium caeni]|uniref:Uncharacterized protein n=1 Tax=Flavobacterium caeni TaxID=490189 RepID=A0A1G5E1I7_9FLAO|nr:hypothetical protein [Flavobacterium caeni]SCY20581.1 hypothetical protein SAMN02927903_00902 [Flavobacterium caeni]
MRMKFVDLFEHAIKLGFKTIPVEEQYYKMTFETNDSLNIEISFPNDTIDEDLGDNVNIDWDYRIKNKENVEIHREWFDYYSGNAKTKIENMQSDIFIYINNFANSKFKIIQRSALSLFGVKFFKYKELIFE